ncbi:hypothetical protein KWH01_17370 [Xanthomonas campestris pv. merremiae]|nr:hypothetical protein [Xanthomonas campestris pv. merremiae]
MDVLGSAIRAVLELQRSGPQGAVKHQRGGAVGMAKEAQEIIEAIQESISDLGGGPRTARRVTVLTLTVAALDIAWAMCYLIRSEPSRTHTVALTLWRSLLEIWLRAAFFAVPATDEEVQRYFTTKKMPNRPWPGATKLVDLSPNLLSRIVGPHFCPEDPGIFNTIASEYGDWSGFVHGGEAWLIAMDGGTEITSQVPQETILMKLNRVAVISLLCHAVGLEISRDQHEQHDLQESHRVLTERVQAFQRKWD